jgi:peptidoglycan/LPS O-acetylase OafA/YrhL
MKVGKHFPSLDGIRGIAALWVIEGHAVGLAAVKHVGLLAVTSLAVDLFMMLSGFLMVINHADDRTWGRFLWRRFFRLAPLFYLALIVAFVIAPAFLHYRDVVWATSGERTDKWVIDAGPQSFMAHLSFLYGLSPHLYWSTALPDWSLSLEAQFYLAFPFLIWASRRIGVGAMAGGFGVLSIALVIALHGYLGAFELPSPLPLKLPIFLAGMLLAFAVRDPGRAPMFAGLAVLLCGLPLVASEHLPLLVVRCGMVLALGAAIARDAGATSGVLLRPLAFLSMPLARWLGDCSYAAYLIHLPVMVIGLGLAEAYVPHRPFALYATALTITLPVTYALAWAAFTWVEKPGIALGKLVVAHKAASHQTV